MKTLRAIRNLIFTLFIVFLTITSAHAAVESDSVVSSEYLLKAAFLYKFINFVDWPEELFKQSEYFNLCILGKNPFGDAIFVFDERQVRNRTLKIKLIRSVSEVKDCRILYISPSRKKQIDRIIKKVSTAPVLTVADLKGFAKKGVIINLIRVSNRIRFEINLAYARRAGLRISSKLLRLAVKVYDEKKVSVRRDIKESFN